MTTKYKNGKDVPTMALCLRLDELAEAVTKQDMSVFTMRIPAEHDYCADLVMSTAADRLQMLQPTVDKLPKYEDTGEGFVPGQDDCWMIDQGLIECRRDVAGFDIRSGGWFYGNSLTRFFSTREAAEAAQQKTGDNDD